MKEAPFVAWAAALVPAFAGARPRNDGHPHGDQPSQVELRLERPAARLEPARFEPTSADPPSAADEPVLPAAAPLAPAASADATDAPSAARAYELWRERVWRFSSRLGVPPEALEDATQDVFAAVCRRWPDFSGLSTRRTWVLGFVPKIAAQYRRRYARRRVHCVEAPAAEERASGHLEHDPFESAARIEARHVVQAFLEGLRDPDRQLFVLVDLEGESVVEAAAILEMKTRYAYKCLERIRRDFELLLVRHRAGDEWRLK